MAIKNDTKRALLYIKDMKYFNLRSDTRFQYCFVTNLQLT